MKRFLALKYAVIFACLPGLALAQSTGDTAFQQSFKLDVADSSGFAFMTYDVPASKRLVIRYLAVSTALPAGQRLSSSVQTTLRGTAAEYPQSYTAQSNGDGTDELVSTQPVSIQADGGTTVYFQVFRRAPRGTIRVIFVVSGDLIPLPVP